MDKKQEEGVSATTPQDVIKATSAFAAMVSLAMSVAKGAVPLEAAQAALKSNETVEKSSTGPTQKR